MKRDQLDVFTTNPPTQEERERFWARVQKTDTCWLWTGAIMINGYGTLTMRKTHILAHRLSYYLDSGEVPRGMDVCHTCDTRNCINPAHLFPGTRAENLHNMAQKGRWNRGDRYIPRGEEIGTSKLTQKSVLAMRTEYASGGISQRALARKYGITRPHFQRILRGDSWRQDTQSPGNKIQKVERACLNCGTVFLKAVTIYREENEPLCSADCRKEWRRRDIADQFWAKVDRSNPDGCWNWQGRLHINGYGQVGFRVKDRLAHRFAWRLTHGDIPVGLHILHSCDNPSCVNPAHLSTGTRLENMQDASRKGRTHAPRGLRGELNPKSKLSNVQRQEIRERYTKGESYGDLAKAYDAGKTTIARIVKGVR